MNEHAEPPYNRRHTDYRLDGIEKAVDRNTIEIGRIRTSLGDRLTTLIFDLDERYLTRKDAQELYVPRKEHEASRRENRSLLRDRVLIAVAAGGYITGLVEFVLTRH